MIDLKITLITFVISVYLAAMKTVVILILAFVTCALAGPVSSSNLAQFLGEKKDLSLSKLVSNFILSMCMLEPFNMMSVLIFAYTKP